MVSDMGVNGRRCAALALALALAGCATAAVVGAGATMGYGVTQERSTRAALTDLEIETTINNGLLAASPELFRRVGVEVVEGRVLLTGAVSRPEDRVRAIRVAWAAQGVREVESELTLAGDPGVTTYASDLWITTRLNALYVADPLVAPQNVSIETHRGVVTLMGLARSEAELSRAADLAASLPGVIRVVSYLRLIGDPRRRPGAAS